jgi:hypothetical protein
MLMMGLRATPRSLEGLKVQHRCEHGGCGRLYGYLTTWWGVEDSLTGGGTISAT